MAAGEKWASAPLTVTTQSRFAYATRILFGEAEFARERNCFERPDHRLATEFRRACRRLKLSGITLHSYRYAWAERARSCGYPERFAQEALGHQSKAVHRA